MTEAGILYVKSLFIRDFKGVLDVGVVPNDYVVTFAGENGSGKSSALDALWSALQWSAASKDIPDVIANGKDEAWVRVDLEEYVVTRTWTRDKGTKIEVRDKKGKLLKGAKKILAAIVGKISLDPTAFGRLRDTEQREALIRFISDQLPFDVDEMKKEREKLFEDRKTAGQDARRLEGHFVELPEAPPGTPKEPVDIKTLSADLEAAVEQAALIKQVEIQVATADERAGRARDGIELATRRAAEALERVQQENQDLKDCAAEELAAANADTAAAASRVAKMNSVLKDNRLDADAARERIASAEEINGDVRAAETRRLAGLEAESAREHYRGLSDEIDDLDAKKIAALAKVKMPVKGLSFDDSRVLYDPGEGSGPVPLRQCSQAQRIIAGIYLSLSGDHRLRAVRVTDAALLSKATMAMLREKARAGEFQLFNERADDRGAECYVIEAGEVLSQCSKCALVEDEKPVGKAQDDCEHEFEWDRLEVQA